MANSYLMHNRELLIEEIHQTILRNSPPEWKPVTPARAAKYHQDIGYHLDYLADALAANDTSLFVDYVCWVAELFESLGFDPMALQLTLDSTAEVLVTHASEGQWAQVRPFFDAAASHLQSNPEPTSSYISTDDAYGKMAGEVLAALLVADRQHATQLIQSAATDIAAIEQIYLRVFQPILYEIGRLWQTNQATVAEEHYVTASIQFMMSQFLPQIMRAPHHQHNMVATSVSNEMHEIGIRMVADIFEMHGWHTYYLGANVPVESILDALVKQRASLLSISATITYHLHKVTELIEAVRQNPQTRHIPVLVGGRPFNLSPNLWQRVGANGYGRDAVHALGVANALLAI